MSKEFKAEEPSRVVRPAEYTTAPDATVNVVVGTDKRKFVVHKQLLISKSPFFAACLSEERFAEAIEGEVSFEEDDADAFGMIVNWIYGDKPDLPSYHFETDATAAKAWLLADKLLMIRCKNDIMDAIRHHFGGELLNGEELLNISFSTLSKESSLRKFFFDQYMFDLIRYLAQDNGLEEKDREFMQRGGSHVADMIDYIMLYSVEELTDPCEAVCAYHDHSDGSKC